MAWQAYTAAAGMAILQKMMASKAAIGKEFQEGWQEAESGGMGMGEAIRPGISQDKSVLPGMAKSMIGTYMEGASAGGEGTVSETLGTIGSSGLNVGSTAVQGMAAAGDAATFGQGLQSLGIDMMDQVVLQKLMEYIGSFQKGNK